MAQRASEIVRELRSHRERLGEDLDDLQAKVKENADWHTHYRENPHWFLGAAFVGGVIAAALVTTGKKTTTVRYVNAPERVVPSASHSPSTVPHIKSELQTVVDEVKGALIAFGVAKLKDTISNLIPGLDRHLDGGSRRSARTET